MEMFRSREFQDYQKVLLNRKKELQKVFYDPALDDRGTLMLKQRMIELEDVIRTPREIVKYFVLKEKERNGEEDTSEREGYPPLGEEEEFDE